MYFISIRRTFLVFRRDILPDARQNPHFTDILLGMCPKLHNPPVEAALAAKKLLRYDGQLKQSVHRSSFSLCNLGHTLILVLIDRE